MCDNSGNVLLQEARFLSTRLDESAQATVRRDWLSCEQILFSLQNRYGDGKGTDALGEDKEGVGKLIRAENPP